MKATINGVTVEGTPQEIADYQRIVSGYKPFETVRYVPKREETYAWNGPVSTLYGGERKDGEIIKR